MERLPAGLLHLNRQGLAGRPLTGGVGKPNHRMAASLAVAFSQLGPLNIIFKPDKHAGRTLISTLSQYYLVSWTEFRNFRCRMRHLAAPAPLGLASGNRNGIALSSKTVVGQLPENSTRGTHGLYRAINIAKTTAKL